MNSRQGITNCRISSVFSGLEAGHKSFADRDTVLFLTVVVGHDDACRESVFGGGLNHAHGGIR